MIGVDGQPQPQLQQPLQETQLRALLEQQAQLLQQTVQAQALAHQQAMQAVASMVTSLQAEMASSKDRAYEPKGLTTQRAFTLLPNYSGKVEEYEGWRFQMTQFLAEDPFFVKFLEWIEELGDE